MEPKKKRLMASRVVYNSPSWSEIMSDNGEISSDFCSEESGIFCLQWRLCALEMWAISFQMRRHGGQWRRWRRRWRWYLTIGFVAAFWRRSCCQWLVSYNARITLIFFDHTMLKSIFVLSSVSVETAMQSIWLGLVNTDDASESARREVNSRLLVSMRNVYWTTRTSLHLLTAPCWKKSGHFFKARRGSIIEEKMALMQREISG